MSKYLVIGIIILLFIGLVYYWLVSGNDCTEKYGNFCNSCRGKLIGDCMKCINCGFITKNGYGKCVDGDMYGPYEDNPSYKLSRWIWNDPFWSDTMASDLNIYPATI